MTLAHDVHAPGANAAPVGDTARGLGARGAMEREADRAAEQIATMPHRATAASGIGGPLEPALRHEMEAHFGHDFSQVRIHADAGAARLAGALDAAAFTIGGDVVFNRGRFAPGTPAGRRLLAHELTHVVQQQRAAAPVVQRQPLGGGTDDAQAALTWESYRQSITVDAFDSDSAALTPAHTGQLDAYKLRLQTLLGLYPESFFTVIGHTDTTDSEAHNKLLGQQRADAVKAQLTGGDYPVPAGQVSAGSLGETAPAVPKKGREPRNRRVEIIPTLRRRTLQLAPLAPPGQLGGSGTVGDPGTRDRGFRPGFEIDPDPLGLRRPKLPGLGLPEHNWLEDALDRDPLIRELPKWVGDKLKGALKDADEMVAEKVIDGLPLDDKVKAADTQPPSDGRIHDSAQIRFPERARIPPLLQFLDHGADLLRGGELVGSCRLGQGFFRSVSHVQWNEAAGAVQERIPEPRPGNERGFAIRAALQEDNTVDRADFDCFDSPQQREVMFAPAEVAIPHTQRAPRDVGAQRIRVRDDICEPTEAQSRDLWPAGEVRQPTGERPARVPRTVWSDRFDAPADPLFRLDVPRDETFHVLALDVVNAHAIALFLSRGPSCNRRSTPFRTSTSVA